MGGLAVGAGDGGLGEGGEGEGDGGVGLGGGGGPGEGGGDAASKNIDFHFILECSLDFSSFFIDQTFNTHRPNSLRCC